MNIKAPNFIAYISLLILLYTCNSCLREEVPKQESTKVIFIISPSPSVNTPTIPTPNPTERVIMDEIQTGKIQASIILGAIDAYFKKYNAFPLELDDLIPEFLMEIPLTNTGQKYEYSTKTDIFTLSFDLASVKNGDCSYLKRLEFWDCGLTHNP